MTRFVSHSIQCCIGWAMETKTNASDIQYELPWKEIVLAIEI